MRHEVSIVFSAQHRLDIPVDAAALPAPDAARQWLDGEFTRMDCSPLRPSGKLLTADKLLSLADTAGAAGFEDKAWCNAFAHAAAAVVARPRLTIDLANMKVSY